MDTLEIETAIATLNSTGDYHVLPRLNLDREKLSCGVSENTQKALCLDTETTGLNYKEAGIIELGIVSIEFDPVSGEITRVIDRYSAFEDPGVPIPNEITKITGITSEMVRGRYFDDNRINAMAREAHLVIAHNAAFDRKFVEARFPEFSNLPWACTMSQIEWKAERISSKSLEYVLFKSRGMTINAHRALDDAEGVVGLLLGQLPVTGTPILKKLLEKASETTSRVSAIFAPYEKKDLLKGRGYRWCDGSSGGKRAWWKDVPFDQENIELQYLASEIYPGGDTDSVEVRRFDAVDRFSIRV